jgi:uncharacterized protein
MNEVGKVETLMRFPVKSMQGESLEKAYLTQEGIWGDRQYALRDKITGHIASAKHPKKWERLMRCRAYFSKGDISNEETNSLRIVLPDQTVVDPKDLYADKVLSNYLGREISLVTDSAMQEMREADRTPLEGEERPVIQSEPLAIAASEGKFFDYAPLHLITDGSLRKLESLYTEGDFDIQRFRPNVLIKLHETVADFVENRWLGKTLSIGDEVLIRIIDPTPRCLVPTLSQGVLQKDKKILKTLVQHNAVASYALAPGVVFKGVLGVYAQVEKPGMIREGDVVKSND